jgi:hypothetical protein
LVYFYRYTIRKFYCPHCGLKIRTERFRVEGHVHLGPEFMICSRCIQWYRSGFKEWPTLTPFEQRWYGTGWKFLLPLAWFGLLAWLICAWFRDSTIEFLPILGLFTLLLILSIPVILLIRAYNIRQSCWRFHMLNALYQTAQATRENRNG